MAIDKQNMLKILEEFPNQCKEAIGIAKDVEIHGKFDNICICGLGASGIVGELIKPFEKETRILAHHNYGLPNDVDKKSLVFVISYSGNTEEALSSYEEAKKRGATIITIASGGRLSELEKETIIIPSGYPPRSALGYLFLVALSILSDNHLIGNQQNAMEEAIKLLQPEQVKREAEQLAGKIYGKIPIFYSSQNLAAVAYRMKTQINENAKQPAFCHIFPEMNHNEINGFKNMGKRMVMVFIRDENDPPQIKRRMDITKTLIENETNAAEISVRGKSLLARILTTVYVGDMASYYLATMNNEDPTPVPIITELKARLEG